MKNRDLYWFGEQLVSESSFTRYEETPWADPALYLAVDGMAAELEVMELLIALVKATKPRLVVETGTHLGRAAVGLLAAVRSNGVGRVVSIENNAEVLAEATRHIEHAFPGAVGDGDGQIALVCRDAREVNFVGPGDALAPTIDFLFSDSGADRVGEIDHMRGFLKHGAFVAVHDSLKHKGIVGDLRKLKWITWIDIPTPRGLTIGRVK